MATINLGKVVGENAKINGQNSITLNGINGINVITEGSLVSVDGDAIKTALTSHTQNTEMHVTADEKTLWNNKAEVDNSVQIVDLGDTETDTKSVAGTSGKTTIYKCTNWIDYPSTFEDGRGTVISINYDGTGIAGTDSIWCKQFIISPDGKMFQRNINDLTVADWQVYSSSSGTGGDNGDNGETGGDGGETGGGSTDPEIIQEFGFELDQTDSNPDTCVHYLGNNITYNAAHMDYSTDTFDYGNWANAWFIKNIKPVMMNYDGTVAYELDPNDYEKKKDGTASDIEDDSFEGNVMIGIPTVWYYVDTSVADKPRFWFSNTQVNSDYKAYAHINAAGEVMPYTYMNAYDGWVDSKKRMRSISGVTPTRDQTAYEQMTASRANNNSDSNIWDMHTLCDHMLIELLLILIGKSTNTQSVFGNGNMNGYYNKPDRSDTNGVISTGTMNTKGLFWGSNADNLGVKVFGIENFWGNIWKRVIGFINNKGTFKIKMTKTTDDGSTATDYNLNGDGYISIEHYGSTSGYISSMTFNQYGMFPGNWRGSDSTYYCDYIWYVASNVGVALFGGTSGMKSQVGAFMCALYYPASSSDWHYGCGLSCKP